MPSPAARRSTCGSCGERFSIGYGMQNHLRDSPGCSSASPGGVVVGEVLDQTGRTEPYTVSSYMEALAEKGTLDPQFQNKYITWGPTRVNRVVTECSKFLRCTEVGTGSSRRHAQTFLDYTKSMGGRAHILPKTVEGCWNIVEKVTFRYLYMTFYYSIIYCLSHFVTFYY